MKRILIVEDELRMRIFYSNFLFMSGFQVLRASNIWEAASAVIDEKLDLILLDIHIPETNAGEFFDMVKDHDPKIKIVIFSVEPIEKQQKLIPQAIEYFDKSHGPQALLEKINHIIG